MTKILSQQPWVTAVDFAVRYPDSPDEAKAIGRIAYLLRDSIHENRWHGNRYRVKDLLFDYDMSYAWFDDPKQIAEKLDEVVYDQDSK